MAGSGFMEFQPETVLTATQMNEYLMLQAVMYFADESTADTDLGVFKGSGTMAYFEDIDRPHFWNASSSTWDRLATKAEVDAQENRTGQVLLYMEVIN